jgi:hypothetical protein
MLNKSLLCGFVLGLAINFGAGALPVNAQGAYICTFQELSICTSGNGCSAQSFDDINLARRVSVDIVKGRVKSLTGKKNLWDITAKARKTRDNVYFLQGVDESEAKPEELVGWTIFLNTETKMISGSAVNADVIFSVFGRCEE